MSLIQTVTDWFTESLLSRIQPDLIELGSRHFRRIRGQFANGKFSIEESVQVDAPRSFVLSPHLGASVFDIDEFEETIRSLFAGNPLKNRTVSVIIPDQAFHIGLVSLPAALLQTSLQPIVEREVQSGSPRPLAEYRTSYEIGMGKGPKRNLLFSCLTHGAIAEYCGAFEHLGLIPVSIQPSFIQLAGLMKLIEADSTTSPSILIHIGHEATTLIIVLGGLIRRVQVIPVGSGDFTKALAVAGSLTPAQAEQQKRQELILLDEPTADAQGEIPAYATLSPLFTELLYKIYNVLQAHTVEVPQENSFRRIVLSGGGSALRNLDRLIAANLGLSVDHLGRLLKPFMAAPQSKGKTPAPEPINEAALSGMGPMLGAVSLQSWQSNRFDRMVA